MSVVSANNFCNNDHTVNLIAIIIGNLCIIRIIDKSGINAESGNFGWQAGTKSHESRLSKRILHGQHMHIIAISYLSSTRNNLQRILQPDPEEYNYAGKECAFSYSNIDKKNSLVE